MPVTSVAKNLKPGIEFRAKEPGEEGIFKGDYLQL